MNAEGNSNTSGREQTLQIVDEPPPTLRMPPRRHLVPLRSVLNTPAGLKLLLGKSLVEKPNPKDAVSGHVVGWQPVISTGRNRRCKSCGKKAKRCRCLQIGPPVETSSVPAETPASSTIGNQVS